MRIALTVDPELPVPCREYGGIERIVEMLIHGLLKRGHEVVLFADERSRVPCELVPYPGKSSFSKSDSFKNMRVLARETRRRGVNIIHSHSRLLYLLPVLTFSIPKIMTYHRHISRGPVLLGSILSAGRLHFTAVAGHLFRHVGRQSHWHVVYNGVPLHLYDFKPSVIPDAPLVFLGRVEYIKGTHLAIEVAQKSGRRLLIAGNIPSEHQDYFENQIRPKLIPGRIDYLGPVDDKAKNKLLGEAACLLMPILWEEPFGLVVAEALACGTPVIALNRGAMPEILTDSVNGFLCDSVNQMVDAVNRLGQIQRRDCRQTAERRFSDDVIVNEYEKLYKALQRN